jgi:hypothetical protein
MLAEKERRMILFQLVNENPVYPLERPLPGSCRGMFGRFRLVFRIASGSNRRIPPKSA